MKTINNQQSTINSGLAILNSQFSILNYAQRGSALIIVMLIIAAASAAAFGLSRIFLADVRIAASLEDTVKAYFLAEAGVEEGLLRYRVDRNDPTLTEVPGQTRSMTMTGGSYTLSATSLTSGNLSSKINYPYAFDTIREAADGNGDYSNGDVPQDETVEVATPYATDVTVVWRWLTVPANPECGVEITRVLNNGTFDKVLVNPTESTRTVTFAARDVIRVKPLCEILDWLAFGADQPIGRTLQTIDSTGTVGRAKRKLTATLNRRSGSIVGFWDFVLGTEGDIIVPPTPLR